MISPTDISTAVSRVLARYDVREAYLFGSFARGEQTPESDIDLRLACGATMTFGTLYELSLELEKELGRKVDIVTNPPEHMRLAFRKSIEQDEVAEHNILGIGARKNLTLQHRRPCLATDRHRVRFETQFIRNLNTKIIVVYLSFQYVFKWAYNTY